MRCENCGIHDGTLKGEGYSIQITRQAENSFRRSSKTTVWTCTRECAVQALGISKYGTTTHKWPIKLAQFRATVTKQDLGVTE